MNDGRAFRNEARAMGGTPDYDTDRRTARHQAGRTIVDTRAHVITRLSARGQVRRAELSAFREALAPARYHFLMSTRFASFVLSIAMVAAPSIASAGADGTVAQAKTLLTVVDAFAWEEPEQELTPEKRVIHVWLADHPLDHKALAAATDLRAELNRQANKDAMVELEFSPTGEWQGGVWSVPDSQCGPSCARGAAKKASTKMFGNTLQGTIAARGTDYSDGVGPRIDLTLDAKIEKRLGKPTASPVVQ